MARTWQILKVPGDVEDKLFARLKAITPKRYDHVSIPDFPIGRGGQGMLVITNSENIVNKLKSLPNVTLLPREFETYGKVQEYAESMWY